MTRVQLFDQNDTHFATFDLPELPRKDDTLEIALPGDPHVKSFEVERVVYKMVYLPLPEHLEKLRQPGEALWKWEFSLYGNLYDPKTAYDPNAKCVCSNTPDEMKCPQHGHQSAGRELCPLCQKAYLGYCAQGEYCTDDDCKYVA